MFEDIYIDFVNKRYKDELKTRNIPKFKFWDDYALFLYEILCDLDENHYYELLEQDIKLFSDLQTGTEREEDNHFGRYKI